jgi:transposase-like protein
VVEISVENLIIEVGINTRKPSTMSKDKQKQGISPELGMGLTLDELVRRGARQVIQQAIEAELAELLSSCTNVTMLTGKQAVVRNGYLPEREVLTAAGPIAVKVPKVRDRSGSGIKFNSNIVPPYIRKSPPRFGSTALAVPERDFHG